MADVNMVKANDTGWINLELVDGVTADYHRIRKIGNRVYVQLYNVKGWTFNTAFTTIPEGFRPMMTIRTIQPTTGTNFVTAQVDTLGSVIIHRSTTYASWVDVMISYLLD